ncbi:MAG TPA: SUMF1/EgtB/PvdO family nonheme iron enzyme, partial [Blastocatellia bacterium]|nr:SUMF1/EgtB/PvdO family nonheme iron enzyme [Blastocatellia bacterium]
MIESVSQDRRTIRELLDRLHEARVRTLDLVADLDDQQLIGPRLRIVNPLIWEIGHVAYFQEFWCLRHLQGDQPILAEADRLYDSARVSHDTRWDLPLPSREDTLIFMGKVLDRVIESSSSSNEKPSEGYDRSYFLRLALFHEQMHAEAITYTRQTLGYGAPRFTGSITAAQMKERNNKRLEGDAHIPGGKFALGRTLASGFTFDNEQPAHEVEVNPFSISRTPVMQAQFAEFVEDRGYQRNALWGEEGWRWRETAGAEHPVYWRRESTGRWLRRHFDRWVPLEDRIPVIHLN